MWAARRFSAVVCLLGVLAIGCSEDGDDSDGDAVAGKCDASAPIVAVDSNETDTDGLRQVYVLAADGEVDRITGDWVASQASFAPDSDQVVVVRAEGQLRICGSRRDHAVGHGQ